MNNQVVDITLFYCSNSYSAEEIHYCATKTDNIKLNAISLPCSGRVNLLYLLKAVETGSDGVVLLTCKIGECKFLQGNLRAQKRIEAVDDLMDEAGFGRGCIKCLQLQEGQSVDTLADEINNFRKQLKTNPQSLLKKILK
jgi:F420-non-reducing hydrogenase iron-sulfur subunit